MAATLKLTHSTSGAEVRRGTYNVVVDGNPAGSVELNQTIDIRVAPGRHALQVRNGRDSSRTKTFAAPSRIELALTGESRWLEPSRPNCADEAIRTLQTRLALDAPARPADRISGR